MILARDSEHCTTRNAGFQSRRRGTPAESAPRGGQPALRAQRARLARGAAALALPVESPTPSRSLGVCCRRNAAALQGQCRTVTVTCV
jgi:hypothetical protein